MGAKKFGLPVISCLLLVLIILVPAASAKPIGEYEVKAAFLYQFTKFIEWPEETAQTGINLCVYGKDPFGRLLDQLSRSEEPARIHVRRIRKLDEVDACHIIFVSAAESHDLNDVIRAAEGKKTVTVSEVKGFIEQGGIINFVQQGRKIRFEINQKRAQSENIRISSKLLQLASQVLV